MIKKRGSKSSILLNSLIGGIQYVVGIILTVIFGITLLSCIVDLVSGKETADIVTTIILAVITGLSIYMIICGRKRRKLVKEYRSYEPMISFNQSQSINHLAGKMNRSSDEVRKNLDKMIKKGFLSDSFIDANMDKLFINSDEISNKSSNHEKKVYSQTNNRAEPKEEFVSVRCSGCGASNRLLRGSDSECEYCGSKLR